MYQTWFVWVISHVSEDDAECVSACFQGTGILYTECLDIVSNSGQELHLVI